MKFGIPFPSRKRCPEIRCSRIWWSQNGITKSVFPFLGTILLHTLGFYQPMPASRTYVGEVDVQLLTTTVSPNHFDAFRAAMHRVLDSRLGILESQCRSVEHQGSKPIHHFTLSGRLLYPQNRFSRGCACAALAHCFAHAHFHLVSGRR